MALRTSHFGCDCVSCLANTGGPFWVDCSMWRVSWGLIDGRAEWQPELQELHYCVADWLYRSLSKRPRRISP